MVRVYYFLSVTVALALLGCADDGHKPADQPAQTIYVVGIEMVNSAKQETRITCVVDETTVVRMVEQRNGWYAFDFYTDRKDWYLLGYRYTKSMLWKNGVLLNDTSTAVMYSSMEVVDNDVYVGGWEVTPRETPTVWKNNIPTHLPFTDASFDDGRVYDVAVSGSDVYAVGYEFDVDGATTWHAMLWKNGQPQILSTAVLPGTSARPMAVSVQDTVVHMVGFGFAPNGNPMAIYWKNDLPNVLDYPFDRENLSWATDITVYNKDVHIAGYDSYGGAIYWKNGEATILPGTTDSGHASKINSVSSIFVLSGDVYISGTETTDQSHAIYWKNGKPTAIPKLMDASNIVVLPTPR